MADTTVLSLVGVGVTPYSARGLTQTLNPISASAQLRRTVNGALINVASTQHRKYSSTISCTDQQAPALNGIWPGAAVTVDCVAELAYPEGGAADRPVVPNSQRTESGFVFYRPRLSMLVTGYSQSLDEYGAVATWQLELEEV